MGCFLLDQRAGLQVYDICSGNNLSVLSGTTWNDSRLISNAAARGVLATCPANLKVNPPLTLVWQGMRLGTPDGFGYIFGINANTNGASSPFNAALISFNTNATQWSFFCSTSTGSINLEGDFGAVPSSGTVQLAITWGSTPGFSNCPILGYLNGVSTGSGITQSGGTISYSSTSQLSFGGYPSLNSNVGHDFGLIYKQALDPGILKWLAAEPYAFIEPTSSTKYVFIRPATTAKAGVIIPVM